MTKYELHYNDLVCVRVNERGKTFWGFKSWSYTPKLFEFHTAQKLVKRLNKDLKSEVAIVKH